MTILKRPVDKVDSGENLIVYFST